MNDCMTASEYKNSNCTAGILLEANKTTSAEELVGQLLSAPHWISVSCASWEEASALPQKLVRRTVLESGLRSRFQGGALIDLRWCIGTPHSGQLNRLEHFLLELRDDLQPLILIAPGTTQEILPLLSALELQPVTIGQDVRAPKTRTIGFEREC